MDREAMKVGSIKSHGTEYIKANKRELGIESTRPKESAARRETNARAGI